MQVERPREVRNPHVEMAAQAPDCMRVLVDRGYVSFWSKQFCQRKCECALARTEINPAPSGFGDSVSNEID